MVDPWNYHFFFPPCTLPPSRYTETWSQLNCLFIKIVTSKDGDETDVVEAYDKNIQRKDNISNTLDVIVKVPEEQTGEVFSHFNF